jgi:hypothetical protein
MELTSWIASIPPERGYDFPERDAGQAGFNCAASPALPAAIADYFLGAHLLWPT